MESEKSPPRSCTCIAPINIAVIKYWGKSNEDEIIPLNDSISITLDTDYMFTKTTAATSPDFSEDSITLNNGEHSGDNVRFKNCLSEVRKLAAQSKNDDTVQRSKWKVAINSENNFPTKAGLASSASGYACLVYTLSKLYGLESTSSELSALARRGSGSACRSLFGGFVRWFHQSEPCIARPVAGADHWPELRCLVAVISNHSKTIGSTEGMRRSTLTSQLLQQRVNFVVPHRVEEMQQAILEKNFVKFAELTMQDSNQFHAICLDTYPPLFYMNATSQAIIGLVHRYNEFRRETKVAYTFDAGPNAVLFMEEKELSIFAAVLFSNFGTAPSEQFFKGIPIHLSNLKEEFMKERSVDLKESEPNYMDLIANENLKGQIMYVINCRIGKGPQTIVNPII
nr:EOG090X0AX4 [Eurycercus lamellatus]